MGPYRANAYQPPRLSWWEEHGWKLVKDAKIVALIALMLIIVWASIFGLAYGLQYVVTGFVGHPVGDFWHYLVSVILFGYLKVHLKRD